MAQIRIDLRYKRIAQDQHQVEIVACSQVRGKHSDNPWLRTQAHIRLSLSLSQLLALMLYALSGWVMVGCRAVASRTSAS